MSRNRRSGRHLQRRGSQGGGGRRAYKAVTAVVLALTAAAFLGGCVVAVQSFAEHHLALMEMWPGEPWLLELITTAVGFAAGIPAVPWGIVLVDQRQHHVLQTTQAVLFVGILLITFLAFTVSVALMPPKGGCPPHETSFPCVFLTRHPDVPAGWGIGLVTGNLVGGLVAGAVSRVTRERFASIRADGGRHREP
ncbi:MAG: hypothetical protein QOI21_3505 [Actinomycetota bacterium]|nr:hypothetical protein [Actinomycetota bacterium]